MNRTRDELRTFVSGRWGARRVRVSECHVIKAETLYAEMLWLGRAVKPGERGEFYIDGFLVLWETLHNPIWVFGRLFLRCRRCGTRATRLYVPKLQCEPECRKCWGLTYTARTHWSYRRHGGGLLSALGITPRDWTLMETAERRSEARKEACARQRERRLIRARPVAL